MNPPEPLAELLSKRELEILALLVENKTNQEIADQLHLALSSVKWYAGEIYGKLGVENRRQAVKKAAELGLLGKPGQEPQKPSFPSGIVTFLFTDIEGSTPLWEQMPEAMQVAITQHHAILRQSIESNGGKVFQTVGDAFQAAFRLASDGLCAALAVQRALRDAHWGPTGQLKVRIGLHTGPAELDSGPDAPYQVGHTLNRVARVMSAGFGGQILLSQEAADLVERELANGVSLKDLGQHQLKGMERTEHLYQVAANDLPCDFPPLPTAIQNPNNLPQEFTSFIGRAEEINLLAKQLRDGKTRLLTLTGSGGTGKTRLSLKVAETVLDAFPAGVWLVELAPLGDPDLVVPTVAQVLGLREVPGTPLLNTLCSYLKNKRALLILDNCEHLLSACADLVANLLRSGPEIRLLASSREILNVPGETPFRVPSLPVPPVKPLPPLEELSQYEAVRLFVERAAQMSAGFALNDSNVQAVVTICRRLDGIPLAIELAASRVRVMPVNQIAARLDYVFRLLMGGARTVMPRQQTLKATIDWSYNLLNAKEKTALQRLSVFSGGWTLEAAERIIPNAPRKADCAEESITPEEMLEVLASLVDKSLVILSKGQDEADAIESGSLQEPRYHMLETIRQYARDRLLEVADAAGCGEAVRDRHLAYYVALGEEAEQHFRTKDQIQWLNQVDIELDNIRLALEWSLGGHLVEGMRLASALKWFWHIRSRYVEGNTWLDRLLALEVEERGEVPLAAGVQSTTYLLAWVRCVNALSIELLSYAVRITRNEMINMLLQAIDLCRSIGAVANRDLFWALLNRGRLLPDRDPLSEEALSIARENHFRFEESETHFLRWLYCLYESSNFEQGAQSLEASLSIVKELQDIDGMADRMLSSTFLAAFRGNFDQAKALYEEAIPYHRQVNNPRAVHLWEIAIVRFFQDPQFIQQAERAIQYFDEIQDASNALFGYIHLIQAEWSIGNMEKAARLTDHALSLVTKTNQATSKNDIFLSLLASGLEVSSENLSKAFQHLQVAGPLIPKELPVNMESRILFLIILSACAVRSGDAVQATRILGATDSVYRANKNVGFPWEIRLYEETLQAAHLALGEEVFRSAWEEGQAMRVFQAFKTFLEELIKPCPSR